MIYSVKTITDIQKNKGFNFKKKFGQNFIIDENTINNIVNKSDINKDTLVIEIGPGIGSLTYKLCEKAGFVLCYEIDNTLEKILNDNLENYNNYKIIFSDFLKENINLELSKYEYKDICIIANLPYYITTPIITKIIDDNINISRMIIMLQKEVGDRLKANTRTKDYNSLTVFVNYYFDIKKIIDVSRKIFIPEPNVDSIVIGLYRKKELLELKNSSNFFKLVRDSFRQKRKTIKNNLSNYDLEKIEKILIENDLSLKARAEEVSLEVFVKIANELE